MSTPVSGPQGTELNFAQALQAINNFKAQINDYSKLETPDDVKAEGIFTSLKDFELSVKARFENEHVQLQNLLGKIERQFVKYEKACATVTIAEEMNNLKAFIDGKSTVLPTKEMLQDILSMPLISGKNILTIVQAAEKLSASQSMKIEISDASAVIPSTDTGSKSPVITPPASPKLSHTPPAISSPIAHVGESGAAPEGSSGDLPPLIDSSPKSKSPVHTPPHSPKATHTPPSVISPTPDINNLFVIPEESTAPDHADTESQGSVDTVEEPTDPSSTQLAETTPNKTEEGSLVDFTTPDASTSSKPEDKQEEEPITTQPQENNNPDLRDMRFTAEAYKAEVDKIIYPINGFYDRIVAEGKKMAAQNGPNIAHMVFGQAYFYARDLKWKVDFYGSGEHYVKENIFTDVQLKEIFNRATILTFLEGLKQHINVPDIGQAMIAQEMMNIDIANKIYGATWACATAEERKEDYNFGKIAFCSTKNAEGKVIYPVSETTKLKALDQVLTQVKKDWKND